MSANCTHCGANLTPADMQQANCRYCGTVLPHRAAAAERVAVVQGLLADSNGNGIPDALEGMVPPGMMPPRPMQPYGAAPPMPQHGMAPPPYGGPVGGHVPPMHGGPVGPQVDAARRFGQAIALIVLGSFAFMVLFVVVLLLVVR